MTLTDEQIKDLRKMSLQLNSLNFEDGVEWYCRYWGSWDDMEGPFYRGRLESQNISVPNSIQKLFEDIQDNFDEGLFYDDDSGNENGSLEFNLIPEKNEIVVNYTYSTQNSEETVQQRSFSEIANITPPWWAQNREREMEKLSNWEFVQDLKNRYGDIVILTYEGGGDSGYLNDEMETSKGQIKIDSDLESITYEIIDQFHSGWENNEGGQGRIEYNLKNKTFELIHETYFDEEVLEHYMTINF